MCAVKLLSGPNLAFFRNYFLGQARVILWAFLANFIVVSRGFCTLNYNFVSFLPSYQALL